ncbi:MAG: hypothetical protein WDM70_08880 [Nitrosomonadales bacterium]
MQVGQEIQYLTLDRDIKGGCRLVKNNNCGLNCERTRNGYALALATGELM